VVLGVVVANRSGDHTHLEAFVPAAVTLARGGLLPR
jgi:hypothetical protein